MTKYLVKIMAICAIVVMLPFAIAGAALTITETASYSVSVSIVGDNNTSADVTVYIDGEETTSATFMKNSTVKLSLSLTGYDFGGWYEGNSLDYTSNSTKLSGTSSYSFTIKGDTELTAVVSSMTYQVSYTGYYDDGTTEVSLASQKLTYGDSLQTLEAKSGSTFMGWAIVDGVSDITTYNKATFGASGSYELQAVWGNQMQIVYYDSDKATVIKSQFITSSDVTGYALLGASDISDYLDGYTFKGWVDADDQEITSIAFTEGSVFKLYLSKTEKTYTITAATYNGSSETEEMTYSLSNGFSSFTTTRLFYTFRGLKYNGVEYIYNATTNEYTSTSSVKLSTAIRAASSTSISVTALWTCDYSDVEFSITAIESTTGKGVYYDQSLSATIESTGSNPYSMQLFFDESATNYINMEESFYDQFTTAVDSTNFYIYDSSDFKSVTLSAIRIYYSASQYVEITSDLDREVSNILEKVLLENSSFDFSTSKVSIKLVYTVD